MLGTALPGVVGTVLSVFVVRVDVVVSGVVVTTVVVVSEVVGRGPVVGAAVVASVVLIVVTVVISVKEGRRPLDVLFIRDQQYLNLAVLIKRITY